MSEIKIFFRGHRGLFAGEKLVPSIVGRMAGSRGHALFCCFLLAAGMQAVSAEADVVEVVVFEVWSQKVVKCEAVTAFRSVIFDRDEKSRFRGCIATGIPYGRYEIGVVTPTFQSGKAGHCDIDSGNRVCILAVAERGADYCPIPFGLTCAGCGEAKEKVFLSVHGVFDGARQVVAARVGERMEVMALSLDVVVTVLAEGRPIGSVPLDLRYSNEFTIAPWPQGLWVGSYKEIVPFRPALPDMPVRHGGELRRYSHGLGVDER